MFKWSVEQSISALDPRILTKISHQNGYQTCHPVTANPTPERKRWGVFPADLPFCHCHTLAKQDFHFSAKPSRSWAKLPVFNIKAEILSSVGVLSKDGSATCDPKNRSTGIIIIVVVVIVIIVIVIMDVIPFWERSVTYRPIIETTSQIGKGC